jgi:monovalent cation/proton antiporter MnhG/PhaG subunit
VAVKALAIDVLLTIGVAIQLFAVLGVTLMRDAFDRMHYAAAATTFGPFLVAAAVIVHQSLSEMGAKALLVAVVLVVGNPVLTHATARMARIRSADGLRIDGEDVEHWRPT